MKINNVLIFGAILLAAVSERSTAQMGLAETPHQPQVTSDKPAAGSFLGTVESVDPAANLIHVSDVNGKVSSLECSGQTRIQRQGKDIALTELQPGDKVSFARNNSGAVTSVEVR